MHLYLKIVVGLVIGSTLTPSVIFGLTANFLIVSYLHHKSEAQKTPFDLVLADTIITASVFGPYFCLVYSTIWIFAPVQILTNWILSFPFYFIGTFFLCSCQVTILLKYFYLKYGIDLLGLSDTSIQKLSLLAKFCLTCFSIILDVFGPFQNDAISFSMLGETEGVEPRVQNGLGLLLTFLFLGISSFFTQKQANSMNMDNQNEQNSTILVMAIIAIFTGLFGVITLILKEEIIYHFMIIWLIEVVLVFLPSLVISRNPQLNEYIQNIFRPPASNEPSLNSI